MLQHGHSAHFNELKLILMTSVIRSAFRDTAIGKGSLGSCYAPDARDSLDMGQGRRVPSDPTLQASGIGCPGPQRTSRAGTR